MAKIVGVDKARVGALKKWTKQELAEECERLYRQVRDYSKRLEAVQRRFHAATRSARQYRTALEGAMQTANSLRNLERYAREEYEF